MELKTEGIVLKRYAKGENDDITIIFTREKGKVLVSSKSTRKIKSKMRSALELFSLNKYSLVKRRADSPYYTLTAAQQVKMFENMRTSLRNIGFCYMLVELLNKFVELEDSHEELFDISKNLLHIVDSGNYSNVENIESYFKLNLLKICGYSVINDSAYLADKKIPEKTLNMLTKTEACLNPENLDIDYETVREMNMFLDGYIVDVLGEELPSLKFIQSVGE